MDFRFTPEQEAFRQEVVAFAKKEWVPLGVPATAVGVLTGEEWDKCMVFRRKLGETGWMGAAWPEQYGGLGKSIWHQMIFHEEMVYYGAPIDYNGYVVAPSLLAVGTEEIKKKFVGMTIRQEIVWCQGYSEPNAGSDLAGIETQVRRDGDDFIVNGSKIWTSQAHFAEYIHLLARSDPSAPSHQGISYLVMDMKSPGISMTPLIDAGNEHHFNQIFFDNVRVPGANIIGEWNQGWRSAMRGLENERGSNMLYIAICRRLFDGMLRYLESHPKTPVRRDMTMRHKLAQTAIDVEVGRKLAYRVGWLNMEGKPFNAQASIAKLWATELQKRVAQHNAEVLGQYGALWHDARAPMHSEVSDALFGTIPNTIAGGTSEVQRDIIASRGLGLPRR